MIKINESFFSKVYNLSKLQEITSDQIVNVVIKDVKDGSNWKNTKQLRNNYQNHHSNLSYVNNYVYRNEWYGKVNDYKDPIIPPLDFLEELITKLKGKIDNDKISEFIYLWFGSSGLNEIYNLHLEKVIYALKNNQDTKITASETSTLNKEKLKNVYKDGNGNLKYFDKCAELKNSENK